MDGWGTSMDCFSLRVGVRPEQGVSFSAGPQRKQRDLCPSVLPDMQRAMPTCLKPP